MTPMPNTKQYNIEEEGVAKSINVKNESILNNFFFDCTK